MGILLITILSFFCLWILFFYPWFSMPLLVMVPLVKRVAITYVPFFGIVDLTVLVNLIVGLFGFRAYLKNRRKNPKLYLPWSMMSYLLLIILIYTIGLIWTTAPMYGSKKLIHIVGIGLPFLILPILFIRSVDDGKRVLYGFLVISTVIALVLIFLPQSAIEVKRYGSHYGRGTFFGSDPNTPAVVILIGMLTALMAIVSGAAKKMIKVFSIMFLPIGLVGILVSGSRANLLGFIISFLFLPFLSKGKNSLFVSDGWKLMFLMILVVFMGILTLFVFPTVQDLIPLERWLNFTDQIKGGDLTSTRMPAWMFCIQNAWDHKAIFGHGPGSYAYDFLKVDMPLWPHNIVLEALYEAGLVGAMAIIMFYVVCIKTAIKGLRVATSADDRFLVATPSAVVLAMSITSLTHWDLDGSRFLFLFAGILYACVHQVLKRNSENVS